MPQISTISNLLELQPLQKKSKNQAKPIKVVG
jgi:hypothetical protein